MRWCEIRDLGVCHHWRCSRVRVKAWPLEGMKTNMVATSLGIQWTRSQKFCHRHRDDEGFIVRWCIRSWFFSKGYTRDFSGKEGTDGGGGSASGSDWSAGFNAPGGICLRLWLRSFLSTPVCSWEFYWCKHSIKSVLDANLDELVSFSLRCSFNFSCIWLLWWHGWGWYGQVPMVDYILGVSSPVDWHSRVSMHCLSLLF